MKDYLKELCTNLNIQLVYTENDSTALSVGLDNGMPCIKVNRVFMGCSRKVANAVVHYYTEPETDNKYLNVLKSYLNDNVVTIEYTIEPPDKTFKSLFIKHIDNEAPTNVKIPEGNAIKDSMPKSKTPKGKLSEGSAPKDNTSSLIELEISSITVKNFYGGVSKIRQDEAIKTTGDDVIELDIEVDDSEL